MAFTKIVAAGINTGSSYTFQELNTVGVMTAGTVQVGAATTVHTTGIDLGSGNITSHNINSTGIITATEFVGSLTAPLGSVTATNGTFSTNLLALTKIGIGTDDPESGKSLHVFGDTNDTNVKIEATASGKDARLELIANSTGVSQIRLGDEASANPGTITYDHSNNSLSFRTNGTSNRLNITSNGNVGIRTDNPDTSLHVLGVDPQIKIQDSENGNHVQIFLDGPNSNLNFDWVSGSTRNINLANTGGGGLRIGIGNTLPLYAMHFKNEMSATPSYIHMEVTGTNTVGGGGGIAFDTSASNNSSNNSLYLATIRGERTSDDDGSNNLVFSTSKAGVAGDDGNTHSPAERLRIGTRGELGLSGANYGTDNQVITSTGTGSAPEWRGVNAAFYGKQDATHNVTTATWNTVKNFATEAVNTTGWSESTGIFTANADTAGTYYVFGSCGIDDVQSLDVMRVGISKNNETPSCFTEYRQYSGATNQITGGTMVARIVTLADGDNVRMKVYHNEGSTEPTEANRTFFGGFRLSV